jgi:hypothetical protein
MSRSGCNLNKLEQWMSSAGKSSSDKSSWDKSSLEAPLDLVELDDTGDARPLVLPARAVQDGDITLGAMRRTLDELPFAIYSTDADGRIVYFNPASVEFAGRLPILARDKWCVSWKIFSTTGVFIPHDQCPMAVAIREGRVIRGVSAVAERPNGVRVPFTPYPTPIRDAHGKVIGAFNMLLTAAA